MRLVWRVLTPISVAACSVMRTLTFAYHLTRSKSQVIVLNNAKVAPELEE